MDSQYGHSCLYEKVTKIRCSSTIKEEKSNHYFSREHWPESIKHGLMCFLFQDILTLTVNNLEPKSDDP